MVRIRRSEPSPHEERGIIVSRSPHWDAAPSGPHVPVREHHLLGAHEAALAVELGVQRRAPTLAELAGVDLPMSHGLSLLPVATGAADPHHLHDYVRSEFYDTLEMGFATGGPERRQAYATMYRDERYKLVVYHGNEYGELFDLVEDPNEFDNLWERTNHAAIKADLLKRSFDATVQATDPGPRRIGRY